MGQELPCRDLPCRCSQKSLTLHHHHVHRTQLYHRHLLTLACLWHLLCPCRGHNHPAGMKLFPPLGSLQATWVTNWASKQQVGASLAPTLLLGWNNPSPLSVCCLDFSLRENYPGHPHGPLWPPQPFAAAEETGFPSELNKLLPEVLSAPKRNRAEMQPQKVSSETSPSLLPVPQPQLFPKTHPGCLCQAHAPCWGWQAAQGGGP